MRLVTGGSATWFYCQRLTPAKTASISAGALNAMGTGVASR